MMSVGSLYIFSVNKREFGTLLCEVKMLTSCSVFSVFIVFIAVVTIVVLLIGFRVVVRRWGSADTQIEHFFFNSQVSMINNATQPPDEVPIFFPYPVMPPKEEKDKKKRPRQVDETKHIMSPPAILPVAVQGKPPVAAKPPQMPTPSRAAPPDAAEIALADSPSASLTNANNPSRNPRNAFKAANPYCIAPQHVICEVAPQPLISINAFKYDGKPDSSVASLGPFVQQDLRKQPKFVEEGNVRFFSFSESASMVNSTKDNAEIPTGRNGGCSIVTVMRCTDVENADFVIASLTFGKLPNQKFITRIEDFKYHITRNTWCLLMCVYREKDDGTSFSTFLDNVGNGEEIRVSQTQEALMDTDMKSMVIADPSKDGNTTGVDIAYIGIYDRALSPYERQLIKASCEPILKSPSARATDPKVVADYDLTELNEATLSANKDMKRSMQDKSASKFNLLYNMGRDAVFNTRLSAKSVEMTKSEKFFSPTSCFIDMTDGYTIELFFCVRQFSSEADSVVFCYSALEMNVRTPQIVAGVTSSSFGTSTEIEGHRFSVFYAADIPRFQSKGTLQINQWYHIVFTSESKMFINGEQVETFGRAVVALPVAANQPRYLTIGDYKNADGARVTTDAGNTMNGYIGVVRVYNYPLVHASVKERYMAVKSSGGGDNVYGLP